MKSNNVPTTQKVSHPPVSPKYGAFGPVRPLLNRPMFQKMVNVKHEHGVFRVLLDEEEREMAV